MSTSSPSQLSIELTITDDSPLRPWLGANLLLTLSPGIGDWYSPVSLEATAQETPGDEAPPKTYTGSADIQANGNISDQPLPLLLRDLQEARQTLAEQHRSWEAHRGPHGEATTTFAQLGNAPVSTQLRMAPGDTDPSQQHASPHRTGSIKRDPVEALAKRFHHLWVQDSLGRTIGLGLVIAPVTHAGGSCVMHIQLRAQAGGYWRLGGSRHRGMPRIPRLARHATRQHSTPMVAWDVDTARKWGPGTRGTVRRSFGWDAVFGRAARRKLPPVGDHFPLQPGEQLQDYLERIHNGEKLYATREADSWIPWVLAYARSVEIPRRRIVDTLATVSPRKHGSLQELQDNAIASWHRRGVLPPAGSQPLPWKNGSDHLIDRLLNGMSPHPPFVVRLDPSEGAQTGPQLGQFVWAFTWSGSNSVHHYPQVGVFERGMGNGPGRMPDIEVWTEPVPLQQPTGPIAEWTTTEALSIRELRLRFPDDDWVCLQKPASEPEGAPSSRSFTTQWEFAKWFVRQAILATGQMDWHMARCHIFMEQICAVLCTQLRGVGPDGSDHPLLEALWPFIRSADEINAFGDLTLLSEHGVLSRGACLAHEGAIRRMRQQRATWHWQAFPRKVPLAANDLFGEWSGRAREMADTWAQQTIQSQHVADLTSDQPRGRALRVALQHLEEAHHIAQTVQGWWGESGTPPTGAEPSIAPEPYKPPSDLTSWQAFAAHIVYTATFLHSWVGGGQLVDMGSVFAASSGHRWNRLPEPPQATGIDLAEWSATQWEEQGPIPEHAGFIVSLAELIGTQRWGAMVDTHGANPTRPANRDDEGLDEPGVGACWEACQNATPVGGMSGAARDRLAPEKLRPRINI